MTLTITSTHMADSENGHHAEWRPDAAADGRGAWVCSRLPGRLLTRNEAITALTLAELETAGWADSPATASLRAELGL